MKKIVLSLIAFLFAFSLYLYSQPATLSNSAYISLLTCDPGTEAYAVYGHTAVRVNDPSNGIDLVFNYGVFDFDSPNFLYRFTKGETDYILGVSDCAAFLAQYAHRKSGVKEQVLNLSSTEKQAIWEALVENSLPQNRKYRYNFLYDNCATRPRILIEKHLEEKIQYPDILPETTFRKLIHYCNRNHRWLTFGIDLALGAPLDRPIGQTEQLFLPDKLEAVFAKATTAVPDEDGTRQGQIRNLVYGEPQQLVPEYPVDNTQKDSNPTVICWIFFGLILIVSAIEIRRKRYFRWLDALLFLIAGLAGCLLFFLAFVSGHPATFPNYSLIWLHPLHLILILLLLIKPLRKFAVYYMGANSAILFLFMCGWKLFPQDFNAAFFPLVLTLYIRSVSYAIIQTKLFADKK